MIVPLVKRIRKTRYFIDNSPNSGYIESDYQTVQPSAASGYAVTDYVVFDNLNADSLTQASYKLTCKLKVGWVIPIVAIPEPPTMGFLGMASTGILFFKKIWVKLIINFAEEESPS